MQKKRVALVTGAASGIGKATAWAFAKENYAVMLADVSSAEDLAAEITKATGAPAVFMRCDVSRTEEVEKLVKTTIARFGGLDAAFNNAGIEGLSAPTTECTEANWQRVIDVNLKGVWLCMKYELAHMLEAGGGAIVNCSSIAGLIGFQNIPAYTASKHGVIGLTQTAALEYATRKIRVNAVCPGVIATPMIDRFTHNDAAQQKALASGEPMGRMGKPEEIADAVVWLCSERSSFITGHSLVVDGGWTAQ